MVNPDEVAADFVAPAEAPAPAGVRSGAPATTSDASGDLNLLSATAAPILKRVLPVLLGIVALVLLRKLLKRGPADEDD